MPQRVKRAYKYRFYPTRDQRESLARTFGCVRTGSSPHPRRAPHAEPGGTPCH
ncbi:helix-turn-helix domain-containing protein [Nonomuraea dietziae]|uniref:helix-turn-helix domain-containing protein n=1 Tax=Nonomuraea dietziae TaxID=65515 RepID=UPI001622B3B0